MLTSKWRGDSEKIVRVKSFFSKIFPPYPTFSYYSKWHVITHQVQFSLTKLIHFVVPEEKVRNMKLVEGIYFFLIHY